MRLTPKGSRRFKSSRLRSILDTCSKDSCKHLCLVKRYRGVKPEDFEDFYLESRDVCFRAISVSVRNADLAYELLSASFERCLEGWPQLKDHPNKNGWIVTTALNIYKDTLRKEENRKKFLFFSVNAYEQHSEAIDSKLLQRIRALPEQQRYVIAYRVILDLSVETTAILMELSPSTVSVHLSRALNTLKEHLNEQDWRN
jgi:RNA polymerase sigma factor (sigma-70 family)